MVGYFKESLGGDKEVLLVAHSQGNFYANTVWDRIYDEYLNYTDDKNADGSFFHKQRNYHPSLGYLAIASPANHLGNNLHHTGDKAKVTDLVKLRLDTASLIPGSMDSAVTNTLKPTSFPQSDWFVNHQFISSYLNGKQSGERIKTQAARIIANLDLQPAIEFYTFLHPEGLWCGYYSDNWESLCLV